MPDLQRPYTITVAREVTETVVIEVSAPSEEEAHEKALSTARAGYGLEWERSCEGPDPRRNYVADCESLENR
jgi:hypothetical protein